MPNDSPDCLGWYFVFLASLLGAQKVVQFVFPDALGKVVDCALAAESVPALLEHDRVAILASNQDFVRVADFALHQV